MTGMHTATGSLGVGDVVELEPTIDHSACHQGTCRPAVKCPHTGKPTQVMLTRGRWDEERQATALPYEPVWVKLACGCAFGDASKAAPPSGSPA